MKPIFMKSILLISCLLVLLSCKDKENNKLVETEVESITDSDTSVHPVPFPDLGIEGFTFPTDSTTINNWVNTQNMTEIYKHGWGIWAGLTSGTNQNEGGNNLLVFETWLTPKEIIDSINKIPVQRVGRSNLNKLSQFVHAKAKSSFSEDTSIAESVSYSPAAATYALDNKIFLAVTLAKYQLEGKVKIPDFPNDAITIKPVFKIITKDKLNENGIYSMASWHGPIDTVDAYPESAWGSCVYVDINNNGNGNGNIDMECNNITPENTYNLTDFIHFKINQEDADYYNQQFDSINVKAGDYAILVGMHVTSREITRWTWQTFWWTPNPENPPAPSSSYIAGLRPLQSLNGAANHYAMTAAYSMVSPAQPYYNGESVGDTLIAFNPYLEAGFGPDVFTGSNSYVVVNGTKVPTDAGVRTNCMSCHIYAAYDAFNPKNGTPYSGDAYVSMSDTIFKGKLQLDFAWSIKSNVDTTGIGNYIKNLKKE